MFSVRNSLKFDRHAIRYHYDVSNDFYKLFLGHHMVYSCAYFHHEHDSLDQAQSNKLDYICRKLRLKKGESLLDIGCGWGSLVIHATKYYGVQAHGITLSQNQYTYARELIKREGLSDRCQVEIKDYRELQGEACFDKIASIGMFEHVGLKNFSIYFKIAKRLLKGHGLFLNHGITTARTKISQGTGSRFMDTFVFPNAGLINSAHILQRMEEEGFEILDMESLRRHYAKTLAHWTLNLQANQAGALRMVEERTYRIWILFMAACSHAFETGRTNVYQVLLGKKGCNDQVPLTRSDLYTNFLSSHFFRLK